MFDSITGKLIYKQKNKIYLENENKLCELYVANEKDYIENETYHLYFYCFHHLNQKSIVKQINFAFETIDEACMFEGLLNIDGVGPKTAIRIISKGLSNFNELIKNSNIYELIHNYKITNKTAEAIIDYYNKNCMSTLTSYQLRKINNAIANLQKIGYSKEISEKVVWNRQTEILNNNFFQIFYLLIEDIKNERLQQ